MPTPLSSPSPSDEQQDNQLDKPQKSSDAPFNLPTEETVGQITPQLKSDTIPQPELEKKSAMDNEALDKALQEELESFNSSKTKRSPIATRIAFLVIGLVLVTVLFIGAYMTYNRFIKNSDGFDSVKNVVNDVTQNPNADDDKDGLTNKQEAEHGTNAKNADTDGDNLEDGLEVNTYKSDPTNKDTDGDSYADGSEVSNGFNPNGAGKLPK